MKPSLATIPLQRGPDYRVINARISTLTKEEWLATVAYGVQQQKSTLMVSQNLHSCYLLARQPLLQQLQTEADVVRIDGLPLVWIARLLGLPVRKEHRAGFMDLLPHLMAMAAEQGWKIHFIGGQPGVAERAAQRLKMQHPGLKLEVDHGYFSLEADHPELQARLSRLASLQPDIVLIGMGMPRQERFILHYRQHLSAPVIMTCGAAFDYVAGEIPMAPRWLSASGLEWLFRLLAEPRRLWRRYLLEPLSLMPLLWRDLKRRKHGPATFEVPPDSHG